MSQQSATEVAILGGGCFWCLEAVYLEARGVTRVESGYMGGTVATDLRTGVRRHPAMPKWCGWNSIRT
jgi:peptide methionine sulfoxide reductase MsrA